MPERTYIDRPPRLQPELPSGVFSVPAPPDERGSVTEPVVQIFLPVLTSIGYLTLSLSGQRGNLLLTIPMTISVVAAVAGALYSRFRAKREAQEDREAYGEVLTDLRREMVTQHDLQRRFYGHQYPDPGVALRIAHESHRRHTSPGQSGALATRLWERRVEDPDFAAIRIGVGPRPSTTVYRLADDVRLEDPLARNALRIAEDSQVVSEVPITLSLRGVLGERADDVKPQHALGVVGAGPEGVTGFVNALLVHYAAFHAPTDARLFLLGVQERRDLWRWLGRLPHSSTDRPGDGLCFEDRADREGLQEQSKATLFLRRLRTELEERQMRMRDDAGTNHRGGDGSFDRPFMLLVVDLAGPLPASSILTDLEGDPAISLIVDHGAELGAGILFLVSDRGQVPGGCQGVIELTSEGGPAEGTSRTGFRYAQVGLNTNRYAGSADTMPDGHALEQFASYLEPLRVRESYGADLPRSVLMEEMLGFTTADGLRQQLAANWQRSQQPHQADWLQTALGMLSGGDMRRLTFSAAADGVHGLIAGSTGSGKSELLMTMILGLAYNYDPSIVNFVLVDFKGGAAFEPFRNLPHCVDIVTNLSGNAVERMFASIMAEIHRREAINVTTGAKHIVHYRKNGLHLPPYGRTVEVRGEPQKTAPYPHLFIFIDEFAEMIADSPEYKAQLNSITRLGRALGVTLILAAQRPTGVTDQMRANIKFRIALRVETREESTEVLRRPDAAYLPTGIPGRGYLQVGNEAVELIQVAWTGADYRGGREEKQPDVIWRDRPTKVPTRSDDEVPKIFEVMVDTMADLARERSLPQHKPWPDFLPDQLSLQTPLATNHMDPGGLNTLSGTARPDPDATQAGGDAATVRLNSASAAWLQGEGGWPGIDWQTWAMRPAVGLVDNPYQAEQSPLVVDLRMGHAVVFGASGWGKTTFLRTLVTALATTHAPDELHVYVLDFGGRQLSLFGDLPHVGAVITPDEAERVTRLLRRLDQMLEERKALLSGARADDLYAYNQRHADAMLPAILVVIDNFAEFRESFDNLMPALVSLARESRAYGIHFAVSAELPGSLGGKLYSLFSERLALKLSDPSEYTAIVGRGAHDIDDIPGRGYVRAGKRALAFQAALPVGAGGGAQGGDETEQLSYLLSLFGNAVSRMEANRLPAPVTTLATRVALRDLLPRAPVTEGVRPILGIEDLNLAPWSLDLATYGPHCLIVGPPSSGKTTTLRSFVLSLATALPPEEVALVLIDYQQRLTRHGGTYTLSDLPHVVATVTDNEQLASFVDILGREAEQLSDRRRPIVVLIDDYDIFADEARSLRGALATLASLARQHGTDGLHFVVAGSPGITRSAEELRKQLTMPRLGIALQSDDAVAALNGRIPRSLAQTELPLGRGFVVRSGRTLMLQLATPYPDEGRMVDGMDDWIVDIRDRYPRAGVDWGVAVAATPATGSVPQAPQEAGPATADGETPETDGPVRLREVPEDVDLEALKIRLIKAGMEEDLLALLSPVDMVNVGRELGVLEPGEDDG